VNANGAASSIPFEPAATTVWSLASVPWYCRVLIFAATCIFVGITWDISWHETIGRDTFWTPAHMVIYVGGTLAGCCCGWLVLRTTFRGNEAARNGSVRIWGFYGPIGAWVVIWGALAMLISAPFDDWWHNAYGLDVKILSPPHALLAAGMHHIIVGALLLVAAVQNRSGVAGLRTGRLLFVYAAGVMMALATLILTEYSLPNSQHNATFYQASAMLYPVLLVTIARAAQVRWAATMAALVCFGVKLAMTWILPLFPAEPKLAPIYNPVDHMVPPHFPLLLFVPALGIDLLFLWLGRGRSWKRAGVLSLLIPPVFLGLFFLTQWFFSKFLLSPSAENWVFAGNRYWSYGVYPGDWQRQFWGLRSDPITARGLGFAWLWAFISTLVGLIWGQWMSKVKR
jgi:hypothetical protein